MASSEARIAANRRNALKSTGPRTPEGKARSRANALKHGLTGDGTVVPPGDAAKVAELEAKLAADIPPANEVAATLIHRYAALTVRLDRCADHDAAMTAQRVRNAEVDRDNQRHDEVAALGRGLADDPADAVRRLKQTPEGLEWLRARWTEVRAAVAGPVADPAALADRAGALLGQAPAWVRVSEWGAWCRAVEGDPKCLPDEPGRWAVARVDREIEGLNSLLGLVDWEAEAADRAEAPARALFDLGPEAERMRRYQAAAERHLFRTLRELRQAQAEACGQKEPRFAPPPPAPRPAPAPPLPPPASLPASFSAAGRSILDGLPVPARAMAIRSSDYIDIAASPAAVAAVREQRNPRARRPKLR